MKCTKTFLFYMIFFRFRWNDAGLTVSICQYVWVGCLWLFVNLSSIRLNEFKRIGPNNNNLTTTTTEKLTTTSTWILRSLWWCWSSSSSFLIEIYVDYTCYMMNKINCFVYFLYFQTTRITPLIFTRNDEFFSHSFIHSFCLLSSQGIIFYCVVGKFILFHFFHYK